ncbi:MAG: tetratricopeptide repeat protein, partial [Thermotogae bacterium]|nr:tetratricopeptide repeat protein [Thermotogota bacterium]
MRDKLLSLALLGFVLFGLGCPQGANSQTVDDSQAAYAPSPQNLDEAKKQVQRYRELAKKDPDKYLPKLAKALYDLGNMYDDLGRHEEAIEPAEEAVEIYRKLVKKDENKYLPDLSDALNDLGVIYSNLGRHEEALKPTEEAVKYYRELAKKNPDRFLPGLALALNNLGLMY